MDCGCIFESGCTQKCMDVASSAAEWGPHAFKCMWTVAMYALPHRGHTHTHTHTCKSVWIGAMYPLRYRGTHMQKCVLCGSLSAAVPRQNTCKCVDCGFTSLACWGHPHDNVCGLWLSGLHGCHHQSNVAGLGKTKITKAAMEIRGTTRETHGKSRKSTQKVLL